MSGITIPPIAHPLAASVRVPGSKSLAIRALLVSALADGPTRLEGVSSSDDVGHVVTALERLGFAIARDEARRAVTVSGLGGRIPAREGAVFVGNAGTAARFLTAFLTLGHGKWVLDGDARMRERPIGQLIDTLAQLGAALEATRGCPPVRITASGLPGGAATIDAGVSSQFLSAVLMVAPYARTPVELTLSAVSGSRPYVEMTLAVMRAFGVEVRRRGWASFAVPAARYRSPTTYAIEPDLSAASYFFAAPAVCGGTVLVRDLPHPSLQGDVAFLGVLRAMGCEVTHTDAGVRVTASGPLRGVDADLADMPDTAQTLAAIAPFATTPTRIRGVATSRVKETDRVAATCAELRRLGVAVEEHADGMTVFPCDRIVPATVQTRGDHRMAMAFALVGLRADGVRIDDPSCVSKSFPGFFDVLDTLR